MKKNDDDKTSKKKALEGALYKKAVGYNATETVEEYVESEEGVKLLKKKITKKNVPPDITAIKILLEDVGMPVEEMTDEELQSEKERLLKTLAEEKEKK